MIEGEDSCLVISRQNEKIHNIKFLRKTEAGYLLPQAGDTEVVATLRDKTQKLKVYHVEGTGDYYIYGMWTSAGGAPKIKDSLETEFLYNIGAPEMQELTHPYVVYAYLSGWGESYTITIDGIELEIVE